METALQADNPWDQQTPPGYTPTGNTPPYGRHTPLPPTATAADGTHPIEMHSCSNKVLHLARVEPSLPRPIDGAAIQQVTYHYIFLCQLFNSVRNSHHPADTDFVTDYLRRFAHAQSSTLPVDRISLTISF